MPPLPDDNRCTDCHAGENAFIVHPGTALKDALDEANNGGINDLTIGNNWYRPIIKATWPQNPVAPPMPDTAGCNSCHTDGNGQRRFPKFKGNISPRDDLPKFCTFILPNTLATHATPPGPGTMPPGNIDPYSTFALNDPDSAADIAALLAECKTIAPPLPSLQTTLPNNWGKQVLTPP